MSVAINFLEIAAEPAGSVVSPARFDVCPTWLELAIRHLSDARAAQVTRVAASNRADELAKAEAFEWEFEASLQAMVASGIAVDAFCAVIRSKVQLPESLCNQWRENPTPRYIKNSEVLRIAFSLGLKAASGVRQCLGEILRFRDLAIDPSQKSAGLVFHPELSTGVEWRFAYFRYENALQIVRATAWLIWELATCGKSNDADVQKYVDALRLRIEPLQNSSALRAKAAVSDADPAMEPGVSLNPDRLADFL